MKRTIAISLFAVAAITTSTMAHAQNTAGIYVSGATGVTLSDDQLINGFNAAGAPRRIITSMDCGIVFNAAIGYATDDKPWGRVRAEAEFAYQKAKLAALSLNAVDRALIGQPDKSVVTGMINIYYDTPRFIGPVRAEFGAGAGTSKIDYNVRYNVTATGPSIEIPTDPSQAAFQFMAGLSGRVSGGLELFTQFRYLKLKSHKVERFNRTAGTLDSVLDADYSSKSISVGARYVF